VRFVVERVALGQGFLLSRLSPLPIIPPILHTLLGYVLTLTGKTKEQFFQKSMLLGNLGRIGWDRTLHI
jgi:hypothetical protein